MKMLYFQEIYYLKLLEIVWLSNAIDIQLILGYYFNEKYTLVKGRISVTMANPFLIYSYASTCHQVQLSILKNKSVLWRHNNILCLQKAFVMNSQICLLCSYSKIMNNQVGNIQRLCLMGCM